jgi:AcrR family transcriptional regulator
MLATRAEPSTEPSAEPTAVRLLDAAERLVGERGVDGVSLRAINAAAGSNVAAAHYHFGSKEALVRAVLERRMAVLGEQRCAQLAPLESDPAPSPRAVAAVFVGPLFAFSVDDEGAPYVRFLAALYRAGGEWFQVLDEAFAPQSDRIGPVFARATPELDDDRRARRLSLASETMLRMLADADRYAGTLDAEGYQAEVIDVFTAVLTAPTAPTQEAP